MQAVLLAVGDELLTGLIENTNSGYLARCLSSAGIKVCQAAVIADDACAIDAALKEALLAGDLVLITGGLGPTADDITLRAVAASLNRQVFVSQKWLNTIKKRFAERGFIMTPNNHKQAEYIEGAKLLENERGTAPGQLLEEAGKTICLLPGPPHEMQLIFESKVLPFLKQKNKDFQFKVKTLKLIGLGESALEDKINSFGPWPYHPLSYIARGSEINLQLKALGDPKTAEAELKAQEDYLKNILGGYFYGRNDETLAQVVLKLLMRAQKTVAAAESCTGGLLADSITDQPGSSKVFRGSVVAYTPPAKIEVLGLDEASLKLHGAVSETVARAMAQRARALFGTDYGLSTTGLAGPESDDSAQAVGLVYVALAAKKETLCRKLNLSGSRRVIKERAVQAVFDLLRVYLTKPADLGKS